MAKFPYTTHTGLTLSIKFEDGEYVLRLTGDRVKEIKRGNFGEVMAEANKQVEHYETRKTEEAA